MGYQTASGRWADTKAVTLAASTVFPSGATNGTAIELGDRGVVRMTLDVTAVSGTSPTLDVKVQTSEDGSTGWTDIASFAQQTGVATVRKVFAGSDRFVRSVATVGGSATPTVTASVIGEAV